MALVPTLEKLRAGFGAAGMAAVAAEAVSGVHGLGPIVPAVAAVVSGIAASYFTSVSAKEQELIKAAEKEAMDRSPPKETPK